MFSFAFCFPTSCLIFNHANYIYIYICKLQKKCILTLMIFFFGIAVGFFFMNNNFLLPALATRNISTIFFFVLVFLLFLVHIIFSVKFNVDHMLRLVVVAMLDEEISTVENICGWMCVVTIIYSHTTSSLFS